MFQRMAVVVVAATIATTTMQALAGAASGTVVTRTGVVTHGSIATTQSTIGWLLTCALSHRRADDPITAPGVPGGSHLHDFTGNASTNAYSTVKSMESAANRSVADRYNGSTVRAGTSCRLSTYGLGTAGDTAAYWRPTLFANGHPLTSTIKDQVYYRAKTLVGRFFRPIPQDARLIVGSSMAGSVASNGALAQGYLYWQCDGADDSKYRVPPTNCSTIVENVVFPSCWDGRAMDHRGVNGSDNEHFAYPVSSACPTGYPFPVPQLSEKFKYDHIPARAKLTFSPPPGGTAFMPTYTAHADFWNTWDPTALQYLVTKCLNAQISCGTNPLTPL